MNTKPIFTMKMARYLIDHGFEPIETRPNPKDLRKDVWVFLRTPELEDACNEYIAANTKDRGAKPPVDDGTLAGLFIIGEQPIEAIAKVHGVSEERVKSAVKKYIRQARNLAIAALDDAGMRRYMAAQTDDERNTILSERILQGGFLVHNRKCTWYFPTGEVSGNA